MEILIIIVIVFMVTFSIFGVVNMIKQINTIEETELQKENEIPAHDFMYNWIREKSGKTKKQK